MQANLNPPVKMPLFLSVTTGTTGVFVITTTLTLTEPSSIITEPTSYPWAIQYAVTSLIARHINKTNLQYSYLFGKMLKTPYCLINGSTFHTKNDIFFC